MLSNAVDTGSLFDAWCDLLVAWNAAADIPDVEFYLQLARALGRPAVELGIGYGRVARHVQPDWGVDSSAACLRRCAEEVGDRTQLLLADLAEYRLPRSARFSYAPLNTFNHIVADEHRQAAWRNVYANSVDGGFLALDVALPDVDKLRARDKLPVMRARTERQMIFDVTEVVDQATLTVRIHAFEDEFDAGGRVFARRHYPPMPFRFFRADSFKKEALAAGWTLVDVWGGFDRTPLRADSRTAVWLWKRP